MSWDLVAVAWDHVPTKRGEYPGHDDAARNMPLPEGRNLLASDLMRTESHAGTLAGFSSDLFIVHANSAHDARDGATGALYETLKAGRSYSGYFAGPLREIASIYRDMARRR